MASSATSSERARFAAKLTQADAIAEHYADFVGEEYDNAIISEYKYVAHTRVPEQILARTASTRGAARRSLRVLDLGCGTGLVARPFFEAEEPHVVVGVDVTPEMTACAAQLPYERVVTATAQEALVGELAGETFDVVLVVGMMEFIEHPPSFLESCCAALKGYARNDNRTSSSGSSSDNSPSYLALAVPHKQPFATELRFGILTHEWEPIVAALQEKCGLTMEWMEDFNGYTVDDGNGDGPVQVMYRGSLWATKAATTTTATTTTTQAMTQAD